MKFSPSSLLVKLVFLSGYPTLSTLFVVLGLGGLWGPWAIIVASSVFFFTGLLMGKLVQEYPSLNTSGAPYIFLSLAWLGSLFLAALAGGGEFLYAGFGFFLGMFLTKFVHVLLKKHNILDRLASHETYVWFMFILSAAVQTSLGLARLNHVMSLLPIIIYGTLYGLLGPEVIPRGAPGKRTPMLLVGAYFFFILLLYSFLETVNPALNQYPDPMYNRSC